MAGQLHRKQYNLELNLKQRAKDPGLNSALLIATEDKTIASFSACLTENDDDDDDDDYDEEQNKSQLLGVSVFMVRGGTKIYLVSYLILWSSSQANVSEGFRRGQ